MTGKLYAGADDVPKDPKLAKAYCEGRRAAYDGLLVGDNPHPSGSEAYVAWDAGFDSHGGGDDLPSDGCAEVPTEVLT